MKHKNTKN